MFKKLYALQATATKKIYTKRLKSSGIITENKNDYV